MTNLTPVRERCAACQQISPVSFVVPNDMWHAVVHVSLANSILCLLCFISRADEKCVPWDKVIELSPTSLHTLMSETRGVDLSPIERAATPKAGD